MNVLLNPGGWPVSHIRRELTLPPISKVFWHTCWGLGNSGGGVCLIARDRKELLTFFGGKKAARQFYEVLAPARRKTSPYCGENGVAICRFEWSQNSLGILRFDFANVQTDDNGRFRIAFPEQVVDVYVHDLTGIPLRPQLPDNIQLDANQVSQIELSLASAVLVRGVIRTEHDNSPIPGASISVRYGVGLQNDRVLSDANGEFETYALPGTVPTQLIYLPPGYTWLRGATTHRVPDSREPFSFPPIEVGRAADDAR